MNRLSGCRIFTRYNVGIYECEVTEFKWTIGDNVVMGSCFVTMALMYDLAYGLHEVNRCTVYWYTA
jgi:hypothetical protein